MTNTGCHPWEFKKNIIEGIYRLSSWLTTQFATYAISPIIGTAISIIFVSTFAITKFKRAFDIKKIHNFYEYVKNKVIELELEIMRVEERISLLRAALKDVGEEYKKVSIEEQLKTETTALKQLTILKLYHESLLRAMYVIEPLRHIYGDKVDELYLKIIDLSIKASQGEIEDKDLKVLIEKIDNMINNVSDFPKILLEVVDEKLKQT